MAELSICQSMVSKCVIRGVIGRCNTADVNRDTERGFQVDGTRKFRRCGAGGFEVLSGKSQANHRIRLMALRTQNAALEQ